MDYKYTKRAPLHGQKKLRMARVNGLPGTRQMDCVTLRLWRELDEAISGVVDKYTLEDLVQWQKSMKDNYVI